MVRVLYYKVSRPKRTLRNAQSVFSHDAIEVDFDEVEVGVDLLDGDFAEETLRIPPDVAVVDRRLLHYSGK